MKLGRDYQLFIVRAKKYGKAVVIGDGVVELRTHHSPTRADTDNSCEIEVYDNRASAAAAGVPID